MMSNKSESLPFASGDSNPPSGFPPSRWRTPQRSDAAGGLVVGRYALFGEIASGGMATVHFGRLLGPAGFSRVVAVKRLHAQLAKEAEFVSMFIDEVRLAARVQHPNVVATLDVVEDGGELFLVMEYVHGESLAQLIRTTRARGLHVPPAIAASIACGLLHGLHAAHEATSERGEPLGIIHRDVSPQNVLVGTDGVTRVLDFGIARAARRLQNTREGQLKGKVSYLAPERIHGHEADRRTDVYGAAVVLWEMLTGATLFDAENDAAVLLQIVSGAVPPPSSLAPDVPAALEDITLAGMYRDPAKRFATARAMALALQQRVGLVAPSEVGDWVASVASDQLSERARYLAELDGMVSDAPRFDSGHPGTSRRAGEPRTRPVPQSNPPEPPSTLEPSTPSATSDADAATSDADAAASDADAGSEADHATREGGPVIFTDVQPPRPHRHTWLVGTLIVLAGLSSGAAFALRQGFSLGSESMDPSTNPMKSPNAPAPVNVASFPIATGQGLVLEVPPPTLAAVGDPPQHALDSLAPDPLRPMSLALTSVPPLARRRLAPKREAPFKQNDGDRVNVAPPIDPPPRGSCQPPYTIDPTGAKHFKVDCVIDGRR